MVAAGAQAAEGHVAGGPSGRAVEVHHAGADAAHEPLPVGGVVGHQAGGQAIARGVGGLDRGVEVVDAGDGQEGGEDLLVLDLDPRGVDDPRRDEGVGQAVDAAGGEQHAGAGVDAALQRVQGLAGGAGRYQGAGIGLRLAVVRGEGQAVDQSHDGVEDGVALGAFGQDQTTRAGAALAGGDEGGLDHDPGHGLGVGRVPDHQRIVTAQLERQDDVRIIGELPAEMRPGRAGACEHQGVDRLIQQGCAGIAAALNEIEHALRQIGLGQAFGHQLAGQGRFLRRLEHHRVTGQQGRDDMAVRQVAGKVERTQHRRHPMRAMTQGGAAEGGVGRALAGALVIGADGDVDLALHGAKLGRGLPRRLPGLAADGQRDLRRPRLQRGLIAFDRVDAVLAGAISPVREAVAGALDGGADLGGGGFGAVPDGFAGGGVGGNE